MRVAICLELSEEYDLRENMPSPTKTTTDDGFDTDDSRFYYSMRNFLLPGDLHDSQKEVNIYYRTFIE